VKAVNEAVEGHRVSSWLSVCSVVIFFGSLAKACTDLTVLHALVPA